MNIDEIKRNAPDGATHYRVLNGKLEYLKKITYRDDWYIWWDSHNGWMTTLWKRVEIGKDIKPLN